MHFLVFQHIACEDPAIFGEFMEADGITWDAIELDQGEPIPKLDDYHALLVMGGPMDVWQKQDNPWLVPEIEAIHQWVTAGRPYLGFCLGHQLLAEALGGEVGASVTPEIGVLPVELTTPGTQHWFFEGCDRQLFALQWHSAEVINAPANSIVLAQSEDCSINALAWGDMAASVQFHVEIMENTVRDWGQIPAYANALENALGEGGMATMVRAADERMIEFNAVSRTLYDNFVGRVRLHQSGTVR